MDYTKEKIVEMTGTDIAEHGNWIKDLDLKNDFMGADTFWLSESASRIGKTSDTNEDYTEVVGAFLLENGFIEKDNFTGVKQITKKAPYQVHTKFSPAACYLSLHLEEKFGTIIESEIELGNYPDDKAGVVDLITYKKDSDELNLIEFEPDYSENTLLSTALKIQTHYQTIDKEKLVNDFYSKEGSPISSKNPQIKKVLVLLKGSNAYKEYRENRPNVSKIIKYLQIEVLQIEWN